MLFINCFFFLDKLIVSTRTKYSYKIGYSLGLQPYTISFYWITSSSYILYISRVPHLGPTRIAATACASMTSLFFFVLWFEPILPNLVWNGPKQAPNQFVLVNIGQNLRFSRHEVFTLKKKKKILKLWQILQNCLFNIASFMYLNFLKPNPPLPLGWQILSQLSKWSFFSHVHDPTKKHEQ